MVRKNYGEHDHQTGIANNPAKDISTDEWNLGESAGQGHVQDGMFGPKNNAAEVLIATGNLTIIDTTTVVGAQTGTADDLANILTTETLTEDWAILYATVGDTITVKHAATGAGEIHLLGGIDVVLSETKPLILFRNGADWYEFSAGSPITNTQVAATAAIAGSKLATALGLHDIDLQILGIPVAEISIATGALAATRAGITVDAEGAPTTDTLNTITGLNNDDVVALYAKASNIITVTHDTGGTDSIHLRHKIDILLSETVPLILIRKGTEWYELAGPEITKVELAFGKPGDALATGDNQVTHVMDMAGKLIKTKFYVDTVSSSGLPTVALRESSGGVDIFSTNLTIDASENTSETATTPAVIKSDGTEDLIADEIVRGDIDVAGTGTKGAILTLWFENLSDE